MSNGNARGMEPLAVQDPRSAIPPGRGDSFLNPTGPSANAPAPGVGKWVEIGLFVFFVLSRAIHPTIIDASKTREPELDDERKIRYSSISTIIVLNVFTIFSMICVTFASGGNEQFKSIWTNKRALQVFTMIGVVFAFGDWLEMLSMGKLSGSAYQVLLQSKFIVTAVMMMYVKGTMQTRLQWILLTSLMSTMSLYMCMGDSGGSSSGSLPLFGMTMAFFKVVVSCLGAVLSDKFMKDLKTLPTHVQLVQMTCPRLMCTLLLSFTEDDTWGQGLFHHWDLITVGVAVSFIVKSIGTLYLLASLDALLKNIGEALAVLVIYAWEMGPQFVCMAVPGLEFCEAQAPFDVSKLIAVTTVVMIVVAYLETKTLIEKAKKYDASLKAAAQTTP